MCTLMGEGRVNSNTAKQVLAMLWENDTDPIALVQEKGLEQISDENKLTEIVNAVLEKNEKSVADYLKGKQKAIMALVGQCMAATKGKGNPVKLQSILMEELEKLKK